MRLGVSILLLLGLLARPAWPCAPRDDPGWRCTKYDFMFAMVAQVYVRDQRGELPRRRVNVMKHITSSGWHAREGTAQTVQLFDAANVPDTYEPLGGLQLFVSTLEQVDHVWRINVDNAWFQVMRCKEGRQMRTCLVRM